MAANKIVIIGPVAMAASTATNIFAPPDTFTNAGTNPPPNSTQTYFIIRHIRIVNVAGSSQTFSLFKSTTAAATAGKEIIGSALSIAANSAFDWYGLLRIQSDETNKFIVGGGSTSLTIQMEAEMGIV
jgi:hypothetical protein